MKLTYTNVNGYLIPNLTYKSGEQISRVSAESCSGACKASGRDGVGRI